MENEEEEYAEEATGAYVAVHNLRLPPEPGTVRDMSHGIAGVEEEMPPGDSDDEEGTEL